LYALVNCDIFVHIAVINLQEDPEEAEEAKAADVAVILGRVSPPIMTPMHSICLSSTGPTALP